MAGPRRALGLRLRSASALLHSSGAPAANSTFFCESPYLGRDTQLKCYSSYTTAATFFNGNIECQKYGGVLVQYERYALTGDE